MVSLSLSLLRAHMHTHAHMHFEANWNNVYVFFFSKQECVPVILSDQVELPFQNVVDYTQISIKWPSTVIGPELLEYLASIPGEIG